MAQAEADTATGTLAPVFAPNGQTAGAASSDSTAACASETVFLTELACGGRTFFFGHPLPVRIVHEDGGWTCESPEYRLLAYGHDRSEAESSFRSVFAYCWDDIACEDDENLAQGAKDQKRALLALVESQG